MNYRKIAFIGAGNMARSIIAGLTNSGYPANCITACDPTPGQLNKLQVDYGIEVTEDNNQGIASAEVVVLAVKPQVMQIVTESLNKSLLKGKLFVSIAAGISINRLVEMLSADATIVRTMPNTPSLIGKGMTGLYASEATSVADKQFVEQMMQAVGRTIWVEKEQAINGVIAAAGSSPAYFFLFLEAMEQEALAQGFNKTDARLLVQQSMLGAAEMVFNNPELELSELRAQVTSKGGTTAEAIDTFLAGGLPDLVSQAMRAAVTRANEMEQQF